MSMFWDAWRLPRTGKCTGPWKLVMFMSRMHEGYLDQGIMVKDPKLLRKNYTTTKVRKNKDKLSIGAKTWQKRKKTNRQKYKQSKIQTDKQTKIQTDKNTNRQTIKHILYSVFYKTICEKPVTIYLSEWQAENASNVNIFSIDIFCYTKKVL